MVFFNKYFTQTYLSFWYLSGHPLIFGYFLLVNERNFKIFFPDAISAEVSAARTMVPSAAAFTEETAASAAWDSAVVDLAVVDSAGDSVADLEDPASVAVLLVKE